MLKLLDITQTAFNAAIVVYEAVSDAASEADASHFHELSQKFN